MMNLAILIWDQMVKFYGFNYNMRCYYILIYFYSIFLLFIFFSLPFSSHFFFSLFYLFFLEFYEFRPNSIPKASSRGECCPSLIYSNLVLFLNDVGLEFFSTHLLTSNTSWAWCLNNNGRWSFFINLEHET